MEQVRVMDIAAAVQGKLVLGAGDRLIEKISIDSRNVEAGALFVPLIGEQVDGHRFIKQAATNGAYLFFTSKQLDEETMDYLKEQGKALIQVGDTLMALQSLGKWYRNCFNIPMIGVTGSVGKTSTREMISIALSAGKKVFSTKGNHNSQVGLPLTLCNLTAEADIGVLELGMSEPDQLAIIARISALSAAVVTNVGIAHIEQLGSREKICQEKMSIQEGLKAGGTLFLNGDDDMLQGLKARPEFKTIYFGTGVNSDYRAEDIQWQNGCPSFTAVYQNERVLVKLNVMGQHNILNAMVALAVARESGVSMEQAGKALAAFRGFKGRQQLHQKDGIKIIDDSYNASPDSMKAGLDALCALPVTGKRIALLADMKELGEKAAQYHYEVGTFLVDKAIDEVITIGVLAAEIANGLSAGQHDSVKPAKVHSFDNNQAALTYLKALLTDGDGLLIKGSNSMNLGEIVEELL